jgi:hypothetical protein
MIKHERVTGEARDALRARIAARYRGGATVRALAERYGRSYGFIHGILREAAVPMRPRGGYHRHPEKAA